MSAETNQELAYLAYVFAEVIDIKDMRMNVHSFVKVVCNVLKNSYL